MAHGQKQEWLVSHWTGWLQGLFVQRCFGIDFKDQISHLFVCFFKYYLPGADAVFQLLSLNEKCGNGRTYRSRELYQRCAK